MTQIDEEKAAEIYGHGWAYYLSDKRPPEFAPVLHQGAELVEWMKGFAAAMADNDLEPWRLHSTIQCALLDNGVDGDLLEACLLAAEAVLDGHEWCRWPSVPVRSFVSGDGPLDGRRVFVVLPEAANDEMG
jgi:hypothetical protein